VAFDVAPAALVQGDDFLLRADRTSEPPRRRVIGLGAPRAPCWRPRAPGVSSACGCSNHDLLTSRWTTGRDHREALGKVETLIFTGTTNRYERARALGAAGGGLVERDARFMQLRGPRAALPHGDGAAGHALPAWDLLGRRAHGHRRHAGRQPAPSTGSAS